ncbi:MAG: hypothetical protein WCR67_04115 [Bacilli bacterium]
MDFPNLHQKLADCDALVFFDMEATQFSREGISIGCVIVPVSLTNGNFKIVGNEITYTSLIKSHKKIGKLVTNLTGITEEKLSEEGRDFDLVLKEIIDILRSFKKKTYISYGHGDIGILEATIDKKQEYQVEFLQHIKKNYLDFYSYLKQFIVDKKGQALSVEKLISFYGIDKTLTLHDPLSDSVYLKKIFFSFICNNEKTVDDVMGCFKNNRGMNSVWKKLSFLVLEQGKATTEDLRNLIKLAL